MRLLLAEPHNCAHVWLQSTVINVDLFLLSCLCLHVELISMSCLWHALWYPTSIYYLMLFLSYLVPEEKHL